MRCSSCSPPNCSPSCSSGVEGQTHAEQLNRISSSVAPLRKKKQPYVRLRPQRASLVTIPASSFFARRYQSSTQPPAELVKSVRAYEGIIIRCSFHGPHFSSLQSKQQGWVLDVGADDNNDERASETLVLLCSPASHRRADASLCLFVCHGLRP